MSPPVSLRTFLLPRQPTGSRPGSEPKPPKPSKPVSFSCHCSTHPQSERSGTFSWALRWSRTETLRMRSRQSGGFEGSEGFVNGAAPDPPWCETSRIFPTTSAGLRGPEWSMPVPTRGASAKKYPLPHYDGGAWDPADPADPASIRTAFPDCHHLRPLRTVGAAPGTRKNAGDRRSKVQGGAVERWVRRRQPRAKGRVHPN